MIKLKLFLLLFIFSSACFAQRIDSNEFKGKLILTYEQNKNWLDSLKKLSPQKQFEFILERKLLDTNVVIAPIRYTHRVDIQKIQLAKDKYQACCNPVVHLYLKGSKKSIAILGEVKEALLLEKIHSLQNNIVVNKIDIIEEAKATALYGSRGIGGVMLIEFVDKQSIKLLKNAQKEAGVIN